MRVLPTRSIASGTWRLRPGTRSFSSSRPLLKLDLAYDLHEPPSGKSDNAPILFLHGLFGSKRNNRAMSKVLARDLNRPVYALDLRNHGDSPHATPHTYDALASDVADFLEQHNLAGRQPTIIGHSMGAKTAMTLALRDPSALANIIPVDNAPIDAALHSDFAGYVQGMRRVEEAGVRSQREADAILEPYAAELPVRQFLLTNLYKPKGEEAYRWRIPVTTILAKALDNMADFPFKDPNAARFDNPTLFVRGTWSHYVPDETLPIIGRFFPRFEVRDVESGHWVISENPEAFRKIAVEFLQNKD